MSWKAMAHVIEMTEADGINSIDKSLLLMLAYYHNDETGRCDPSLDRLSNDVLRSKRHIQRTMRSLDRRGFLTINERVGTSSQYDLKLLTREPDVTPDTMSPLTPRPPTREPDVTQTLGTEVSSSEELRSSSSSPDEEEDREKFSDELKTWYHTLAQHSPRLRSPLKAPARYFKEVSRNGDALSRFNRGPAGHACQKISDAFTQDWPEDTPHRKDVYTVPMPGELRGLCEVGHAIIKWMPSRSTLRNTTFDFVRYDDESLMPEIEPEHLLGRIARRPEKFVTALENAARES